MAEQVEDISEARKIEFFKAVCNKDIDKVKYHLDNGVPVDVRIDTKELVRHCEFRIENSNFDVDLHSYLDFQNFINTKESKTITARWLPTALHIAVKLRDREIMALLINKGISVNINMGCGVTPLMIAAAFGCDAEISNLIENGAKVNLQTGWSKTALHYAVQANEIKATKALIMHKAHINAEHKMMTALHEAAKSGSIEIIRLLMKNGAKTDVMSYEGFTPLHFALERGDEEIFKLMIDLGAEFDYLHPYGDIDWSMFPSLNGRELMHRMKMVQPYLPKFFLSEWCKSIKEKVMSTVSCSNKHNNNSDE